jgi:glucose/mannose-6-phosphate isomerase
VIDLDRIESYPKADPGDMLGRVMEMDRQAQDARAIAAGLQAPEAFRQPDNIVVLGMGGSAIGGDLARSLAQPYLKVPMLVCREYEPPAFVGPSTLVIASSYSGGTEETLSAVQRSLQAGAMVLALTTGGTLAELAAERGFPCLTFSYPAQPRAALGYSFFLMLGVLVKLGLLEARVVPLDEAVETIRTQRAELEPSVPGARNQAKRLASQLHGKLAVVYGGGILAEVARRWKGQFNENSKNWAFFEQLSELNHNAVMGYQYPAAIADRLEVLLLSAPANHPRIQAREAITAQILSRHGIAHTRIAARGRSELAQMVSAIQLGDFVTYYLALLNGIDPSTIAAIDFLKAELAKQP